MPNQIVNNFVDIIAFVAERPAMGNLLTNVPADRDAWVYGRAGDHDRRILKRDAAVTTQQRNCRPGLLAIRRGEGLIVEDWSGRSYMDLHGNNCHHIGHRHPRLMAGLAAQMDALTLNVRGFTNDAFVTFAERLAELWPGRDGRVCMVPGGAAAVELALAIARVHTGRHEFMSFDDSFHGRSFGAVSLSGAPAHRSPRLGPLLPGALYVPAFRTAEKSEAEAAAKASFDAIRETLEGRDIACFLAEPMMMDCRRPPDWYWPAIRKLCDDCGTVLVFDEVPTGLGKMGALFSSELFAVRPDITVLGKALGGGALPVAAVIVDAALDTAPELNLGYFTHEKNPLMARAALETLNIISDDLLVENAVTCGRYALERLEWVRSRHGELISRPARGQGMMLSIDFDGGADDEKNEALAATVFYRCMDRGLILNYPAYGRSITLSFPLIARPADVDRAMAALDDTLSELD